MLKTSRRFVAVSLAQIRHTSEANLELTKRTLMVVRQRHHALYGR